MDEISYNDSGPSTRRKPSKRLILFILFFAAILVLLGSLVYFITRGNSSDQVTKSITLTESPTPEATETPTPEQSTTPSKTPTKAKTTSSNSAKSDIKVAIQNGSGESGVAAKASGILKAAGYTVASTGNADNFDYTDVTIQVKSSEKTILAGLEDDLSADYKIGDTSSDLSEDASYDALVIIGK